MKNLQRNKGFTLVELIVSIAILAFIIIAVGGIMFANNIIYRKEKADLTVQSNAQDIYNKINEDIMQAKHVYIEGYVSSTKVDFSSNKVAVSANTYAKSEFLLPTDNYIKDKCSGDCTSMLQGNMERNLTSRETMLSGMSAADEAFYRGLLNTPESDIEAALNACTSAQVDTYRSLKYYSASEFDDIKKAMSDDEKAEYTTYYNRVRYFDSQQISEEATFLNALPKKTYSSFDSLMTVSGGSQTYDYLYITKLVLVFSQKIDTSYCDSTTKTKYDNLVAAGEKPKDEVTVTYTFGGGAGHEKEIYVDYDYKYMTALNTSSFSGIDNEVLTKQLNYATDASGNVIPGCEAQIDAEKDSIKLFLYFADNSMTYTDRGMVKIRNSYVLHDAK